jgi:hypothetical protein
MAKRSIHPPVKPGDVFTRLTVIAPAPPYRQPSGWLKKMWLCRCACDTELAVLDYSLVSGNTKSCGCLQRELTAERSLKHRHTTDRKVPPEYRAWAEMKKRCYNPKAGNFAGYGGRGITVCDEWRDSFEAFYRDMGPRPSPKHSLHRKDNDGPYAPWNCVWATRHVQAANTRRTVLVPLDGTMLHQSEAARRKGLPLSTIKRRRRRGLPPERWLEPSNYGTRRKS